MHTCSIGRLKNQRSALEIQVTEARQEVIDLLSAMARDRKVNSTQ